MRRFRVLLLAAACALAGSAAAQIPYESPHWYITLSDAGYSDFIIYTDGPFPPELIHEMISGEWGAAIGYDGIQTGLPAPQRTMWLEPQWDYPSWTTNSTFFATTSGDFPIDTDGDGLPEGSAVIANPDVQITISWDFVDTVTGTPMGLGSGTSVLSNRYVLLTTYAIKNLKPTTMTGIRFYPFLHGHPANDERPQVRAVYDTASYAGALSQFRYDVTQFSTNTGDIEGAPTGCLIRDHIGFSTEVPPADFGLGHFRGHADRPATGLHVDVENDTLGNQTTFGPDEAAGATRIDLGSLASNATASVRVLLTVKSEDLSTGAATATACVKFQETGADPIIRLDKGACVSPSPGGPYDVVVGSLGTLVDSGGFIFLNGISCVGSDVPQERVTVQTALSDCRRGVYLLARKGAGVQLDYGAASEGQIRFAPAAGCP